MICQNCYPIHYLPDSVDGQVPAGFQMCREGGVRLLS